ncbi:MAG: haloacid dehalogenase type II [Minwuia sp.]|nr:haloacid dehalogenase type II [Minwuia sp.]
MAHPKALLFDVFGTVVDWRTSVAREIERIGAAKGFTVDGHAFAMAWRKRYQPAMAGIRENNRGFVPLDILHMENLLEVLAEFGIDGLSEAEINDLNIVWHRLDTWNDSVGGVNRLKSRHIVATCSNGNIALMVNLARRTGLNWDMVLGGEVAQAYKPEREAYLRSAAFLGLAPEECCMVAAHNEDLTAARSFGLQTAYVERRNEFVAAGGAPRPASQEWEWVASDFLDLATKMGC